MMEKTKRCNTMVRVVVIVVVVVEACDQSLKLLLRRVCLVAKLRAN